jgi:tRNA-Thr(GGU) m(6)t(6)A37 methyltransferase TsaA
MEKEINIKPIGTIHTPYKEPRDIPIQGRFDDRAEGRVELFPEYLDGLKDLDGFSHLILIYYFDRSKTENLVGKPFLEDELHGIFAIRSPNRPNHLGFTIVSVQKIEGPIITFTEVDMLDNTPLLDIKPYVSHFDSRKDVRNGWLDKHFKDGNIPGRTRLK